MSQPGTEERAPLSFKVLLVAAAAYLIVRAVQGVVWLVQWVM